MSNANSGRKARVLLVDDSPDTNTMLTMILGGQGHVVQAVGSGQAALDCMQGFEPDVVLLDLGMPDMNGYELAKRIRQELGYEHTVIVAITGYGQESDRQQSREAGIDHHLLKPITQADLDSILAEWARRCG